MSLQIQHLDRLTTSEEINEALDKLPEGLEQTYRGILQRFGTATPDVQSVLGFIAFAREPLTVADVYAALSFNFGTAKVKSFKADTESFIIQVLPGLIKIVDLDKERIVQFIHFSVKQYLTSSVLRRDENMCGYYLDQDSADIAVATLSLAALEPENKHALGGLIEYAAGNWHKHVPSDVMDGKFKPSASDRPFAAERREAAKHLNNAITAFLNPGSLAFRSSKVSLPWSHAISSATPLHCAARLDLPDVVTRLIEQGADCNAFADGWTPLHYAAEYGADSCAKALLEHGADRGLTQGDGYTPLHASVANGFAGAARTLLEGGADMRARTSLQSQIFWRKVSIGATPLHLAVVGNGTDICKLLLGWKDTGGLADIPDWTGRTALHYAAQYDELGILEILLGSGAKAYARDALGKTPLAYARTKRCVRLLEQHLRRAARSGESELDHPVVQDPLPSKPTSSLTLHASLKLIDSVSSADESKQPSTIKCCVILGWSWDFKSARNDCMLDLTLLPDDGGSDSVHCAAKLYGINTDGSCWPIIPDYESEGQSISLSREAQADCRKTLATVSRSGHGQHHTAPEAAPCLLVHLEPAGKVAPHSPMSFPLPPPSSDEWEAYGPCERESGFILKQLSTAAVHFRSCHHNDAHELDSDRSDEQAAVSDPPASSSDTTVAEAAWASPYPSPFSSVDDVEVQQISPSSAASVTQEPTSVGSIERVAATFAFSTSIPALCGIVVSVAVVYAALFADITREACQRRGEGL